MFSIYSYVKLEPPLVALPTPGDHDLNKLESTLSEDAAILILAFLA